MAGALAVALAVDALLGEPPAWCHPVVWIGRLLGWLEAHSPRTGDRARLLYGAVVAATGPLGWGLLAHAAERHLPWWLAGLLLKPTFAGRELLRAGGRVETALGQGDLVTARRQLGALVSRPTAQLDEGLVCAATAESLAENFGDSWVAPLLAYALFGLGGAYAYRAANTADAMWGYRNERYEWLGKAAARLDDLLNLLPARLAALLLLGATRQRRRALAAWQRDAHRTTSPNAGQSMSLAAGALGVRLEKVGHYALNVDAPTPNPRDVTSARHLVGRAMLLTAALCLTIVQVRRRG
jgi:adenosylcobinamide-phosphate synthase